MKKCPSCNANVDNEARVCSTCGFHFDAETRNKTMMGLPSVGSFDQKESAPKQPFPQSDTLFGFPAHKAETAQEPVLEEDSYDEYDEYDEGDATHLIPASQLQAEFETNTSPEAMVEVHDSTRTYAGLPAIDAVGSAWGLGSDESEEEDDGQSTSVVPASKLFDMASNEKEDDLHGAGFSRTTGEERFKTHGTLMGMSLSDIEGATPKPPEEEPMRSTQFGVPAVQASDLEKFTNFDTPPPIDEESSDTTIPSVEFESSGPVVEDTPTQMWSPGDELAAALDQSGHRQELEDIRQKTVSERESGTRMGLPAVERTTSENPVPFAEPKAPKRGPEEGAVPSPEPIKPRIPDAAELRARLKAKREALRTSRTAVDPSAIPPPMVEDEPDEDNGPATQPRASGVLGGQSYIMSKTPPERPKPAAEVLRPAKPALPPKTPEAPEDPKRPLARIEPKKKAIPVVPVDTDGNPIERQGRDESLPAPEANPEDLAFADTNVAPRDLLARIRNTGDSPPEANAPRSASLPVAPPPTLGTAPSEAEPVQLATPEPAQPAPVRAPSLTPHPPTPQAPLTPAQPSEGRPVETPRFGAQPARPATPTQDPGRDHHASPQGFGSLLEEMPTTPVAPRQAPQTQGAQPSPYDSSLTSGAHSTNFPTAADSSLIQAPSTAAHAPAPESNDDEDTTSLTIQKVFGLLAGLGLIASAGLGFTGIEELTTLVPFLFGGFAGVAAIITAFFPLPQKIKLGGLGAIGLIELLLNGGLLALHVVTGFEAPLMAMVAGVCAAMLAILGAAFPLVSRRLG